MTILAVSTWHERPDLLLAQIEGYNLSFDGDVVHMVHINSDFHDVFFADAEKQNIDFKKVGNLYFAESPRSTRYAVIAHAYMHSVNEAMRIGLKFDYIYFHTSSDIMFKRGAAKYIREHDVGLYKAVAWNILGGHSSDRFRIDVKNPTKWLANIEKDKKAIFFYRTMKQEKIFGKRHEGMFFRKDIFFEAIFPLVSHYNIDEIENQIHVYPIEEFLFTQCLEMICKRYELKRRRNLIHSVKTLSCEDLNEAYQNPGVFGIKRPSKILDSPERVLANEMLLRKVTT